MWSVHIVGIERIEIAEVQLILTLIAFIFNLAKIVSRLMFFHHNIFMINFHCLFIGVCRGLLGDQRDLNCFCDNFVVLCHAISFSKMLFHLFQFHYFVFVGSVEFYLSEEARECENINK